MQSLMTSSPISSLSRIPAPSPRSESRSHALLPASGVHCFNRGEGEAAIPRDAAQIFRPVGTHEQTDTHLGPLCRESPGLLAHPTPTFESPHLQLYENEDETLLPAAGGECRGGSLYNRDSPGAGASTRIFAQPRQPLAAAATQIKTSRCARGAPGQPGLSHTPHTPTLF